MNSPGSELALQKPNLVSADLIQITIPNWIKFNPRPDRVNFSWFRMENSFFNDQKVFLLTTEQKLIYLFVLCEVSKKNNDSVKISPKYLAALLQYQQDIVRKDIQYLHDLDLIKIHEIHLPTNPSPTHKNEIAEPCRHSAVTLPSLVRPTRRYVTLRKEKKELKAKSKNEELKGGLPAVAPPSPKELAKIENGQKASRFIAAYVSAYQSKYPEGRPEDLNSGKTRGQILNWIKDYPLERACELIQVYFQIDCKWFQTKGHNFDTFVNNLNKIGQALDSGQDPGGNQFDWESFKAKVNA